MLVIWKGCKLIIFQKSSELIVNRFKNRTEHLTFYIAKIYTNYFLVLKLSNIKVS